MEPFRRGAPPEVVLNTKGRVRFGFQYVEERQAFLEKVDVELAAFLRGESGLPDLPRYAAMLEEAQEDLEDTLSGLANVAEAPYDPMTGQPFTRLPEGVRTVAPDDDFCPTHKHPQEALAEQLSYMKKLRRRVEEISESEKDKRRQAEREREAEKRTQREADAGNREEQETAIEDRTVSETDPGNREERETGNGDRAILDKAPGFQVVMVKDNRNLAEPEPDHQTD